MIKSILSTIAIVVFIFYCSVGLYNERSELQVSNDSYFVSIGETIDFDVEGNKDAEIGTCHDPVLMSGVTVFVVDAFERDSVLGKFFSNPYPVIVLKDIAVDTVAHEVSHLVDYIVSRKRISDTETRAYLQGYYTGCVISLVSEE